MRETLKYWWFKLFGATCPKGHPLKKITGRSKSYATMKWEEGDYHACDRCGMAWEIRKLTKPIFKGELVSEEKLKPPHNDTSV